MTTTKGPDTEAMIEALKLEVDRFLAPWVALAEAAPGFRGSMAEGTFRIDPHYEVTREDVEALERAAAKLRAGHRLEVAMLELTRIGREVHASMVKLAEAFDRNVGEACRDLARKMNQGILWGRWVLRPKINKKLTWAQWRARRSAWEFVMTKPEPGVKERRGKRP